MQTYRNLLKFNRAKTPHIKFPSGASTLSFFRRKVAVWEKAGVPQYITGG